jgi:opacity protein-like surface antigen
MKCQLSQLLKIVFFLASANLCQANQWNIELLGGANVSTISNTEVVQMNPVYENTYQTNKTSHTRLLAGIGGGYTFEHLFQKPLNFSLGLNAYHNNFGTVNGLENPYANLGSYDTLNYSFDAESYALILEPKLIYTGWSWQPFVLAGAGQSWNRLYGYNEAPTDPNGSAVAQPPFNDHTQTSFAYEYGVGVQHTFLTDAVHKIHYDFALGYRYMNFGKGQLGGMSQLLTADCLQVHRLSTQAVTLALKADLF